MIDWCMMLEIIVTIIVSSILVFIVPNRGTNSRHPLENVHMGKKRVSSLASKAKQRQMESYHTFISRNSL